MLLVSGRILLRYACFTQVNDHVALQIKVNLFLELPGKCGFLKYRTGIYLFSSESIHQSAVRNNLKSSMSLAAFPVSRWRTRAADQILMTSDLNPPKNCKHL